METINPEQLARPSGFSHAVKVQGQTIVFLAGQTAQDAQGRIVHEGDMVRQFDQALSNLSVAAAAAGTSLAQVARFNIYVTNKEVYKDNVKRVGEVYSKYFDRHYPAMSLIEVKGLWDDEALIEVEAIAVIS